MADAGPLKNLEKVLTNVVSYIIILMLFLKCVDEDREKMRFSEMRRLVRDAKGYFLTHLGAVFSKIHRDR